MAQILPANPKPNFLSGLMSGLSESVPKAIESFQEGQRKRSLEEKYPHLKGLPKELQAVAHKQYLEDQSTEKLFNELLSNKNRTSNIQPNVQPQDVDQNILDLAYNPNKKSQNVRGMLESPMQQASPEMQDEEDIWQSLTPEQKVKWQLKKTPFANALRGESERKEKNKIEAVKHQQKQQLAENKFKREEEQFFHKESQEYYDKLADAAASGVKELEVLADAEKLVNSGQIDPGSLGAILKGQEGIAGKIAEALLNPEQAALAALTPELLHGKKEIFGVRLSDADLKIIYDKLPSIHKSPEANRAIIKIFKKYAQRAQNKYGVAQDILAQHGGKYRPAGFREKVEKTYQEKYGLVKFKTPTGKIVEVPKNEITPEMMESGELVE